MIETLLECTRTGVIRKTIASVEQVKFKQTREEDRDRKADSSILPLREEKKRKFHSEMIRKVLLLACYIENSFSPLANLNALLLTNPVSLSLTFLSAISESFDRNLLTVLAEAKSRQKHSIKRRQYLS